MAKPDSSEFPDALEKAVLEAFDLAGAERANHIELLCRDHPEHEDAIRVWLADHEAREDGRQIGPFRILERIGKGGMGEVFAAEQRGPVRRMVAIKIIKRGMDSDAVLSRFQAERQALGLMNHPNIAQVLDAGSTETGQPYFVMELVQGVPITEFCDRQKLSVEQRIRLLQQVCSGVQHAHHKGVIHRDLKPSNILVTLQGTEPVAKIIDFGLARATGRVRLTEDTAFTEHGQILGTLEYMSPEQAEMSRLDIDTRTDVYSLGVLLYEMLVGALPLDRETLQSSNLLEIQRMLLEVEPPKPSTRLRESESTQDLAARRSTASGSLARTIRGDLDWITMKALAKDRTRRYQTPTDLSADLERYLNGEPVLARSPSIGYQLAKVVRRYRTQFVAALVVFLALAAGLFFSLRERAKAVTALTNFTRLADGVRLREFEDRAKQLGPELPASVPRMTQWIAEVEEWLAEMPDHEASLAELRRRETKSKSDEFLQSALEDLTTRRKAFLHEEHGTLARVRDSCKWAGKVEQETTTGDKVAALWRGVIKSIRKHRAYGGLELTPQIGLVPLGRDQESGLLEFWMPRSGERPERNEFGDWEVVERTGLVFVLLPGGETTTGSQREDASAPHYVEDAFDNEVPTSRVTLAPFLLSKHEMTQAQWMRLSRGPNPSRHTTPDESVRGPVESVSAAVADAVLARHGLVLPTEAQWEYACRAGKTTRWSFGDRREDFERDDAPVGKVNIADGFGVREPSLTHPSSRLWRGYNDGRQLHAAVSSYLPNDFGLYNMHGNVAEWCRDGLGAYGRDRRAAGTGEWVGLQPGRRVVRGGSFVDAAADARSARRRDLAEIEAFGNVGVRPARTLNLGKR